MLVVLVVYSLCTRCAPSSPDHTLHMHGARWTVGCIRACIVLYFYVLLCTYTRRINTHAAFDCGFQVHACCACGDEVMLALLLEHDGKKQLDLQAVGGMGSTALQLAVVRRDFTDLRLIHFHTTFTRLSHESHESHESRVQYTRVFRFQCNVCSCLSFSSSHTHKSLTHTIHSHTILTILHTHNSHTHNTILTHTISHNSTHTHFSHTLLTHTLLTHTLSYTFSHTKTDHRRANTAGAFAC